MTIKNREVIVEAIVDLNSKGKNKGQIEGWLRFEHNLSVNESKDLIKEVYESNGWQSNSGSADHTATIEYLRKNYGNISKKDLINGMCKLNGKTFKTNQHAYVYIPMMIEWSKQENS